MNKTLYDNKNYVVRTGEVYDADQSVMVAGYHAVNKSTDVVEYQDTILPQVISFAAGASEHLDGLLTSADVVEISGRVN